MLNLKSNPPILSSEVVVANPATQIFWQSTLSILGFLLLVALLA